jgi:hypothetical protein
VPVDLTFGDAYVEMSQIPWANLPEPTIEQMIAVLLSQMHHGDAARIDGRGGDDGRDVQISTSAGIRAFEVKSFTGRMSPTRRSHVQSSLKRAALLAPVDWTLLVPIDHTPKELEWFEWLATTVPFPITWRGLTWLDGEFAQRPSIARYYLEDRKDELVSLARLLGQESAALVDGLPDVIDRARSLVERANELDPFYRFEVTSDGSSTSVKVIPRYAGAERDRPITARFVFAFPDNVEGRAQAQRFQTAIDYGSGFVVAPEYVREIAFDAPAGLGEGIEAASLEFHPVRPAEDRREFLIEAADPDGRTLCEVPIFGAMTSIGPRGSILEGTDRTGTFSIKATVDVQAKSVSLQLTTHAVPFYPSEMRPLARFLVECREPNMFGLRLPDGQRFAFGSFGANSPFADPAFPRLVEDLCLLQWASALTRKVDPGLTEDDLVAINTATQLLRGEPVSVTWTDITFRINEEAPEDVRRRMASEEFPFTLKTPEPYIATIGAVAYPIGKATSIEVLSARLAPGQHPLIADGAVRLGASVKLIPASSDEGVLRLITS